MSLLRVETHEISGGVDEPRRVRVKFSDGKEGTVDLVPGLPRLDGHENCIGRVIDREVWDRVDSFYHVGSTATGYKWTIFLRPTD